MNGTSPEMSRSIHSQALFEKLFEFSPDAIVVTNSEGRITSANAQVERMFGFSREELIGQPVEILVPERFRRHTSATSCGLQRVTPAFARWAQG